MPSGAQTIRPCQSFGERYRLISEARVSYNTTQGFQFQGPAFSGSIGRSSPDSVSSGVIGNASRIAEETQTLGDFGLPFANLREKEPVRFGGRAHGRSSSFAIQPKRGA